MDSNRGLLWMKKCVRCDRLVGKRMIVCKVCKRKQSSDIQKGILCVPFSTKGLKGKKVSGECKYCFYSKQLVPPDRHNRVRCSYCGEVLYPKHRQ